MVTKQRVKYTPNVVAMMGAYQINRGLFLTPPHTPSLTNLWVGENLWIVSFYYRRETGLHSFVTFYSNYCSILWPLILLYLKKTTTRVFLLSHVQALMLVKS